MGLGSLAERGDFDYMYEELQQKVERERQRLAAIINRFGINHNQTIKQSEKLDKLIVDYLRETNK